MIRGKSLIPIIALCLAIRTTAFFINLNNPYFNIFQDNYLAYAQELISGKLNAPNNMDSRLFPGYPLLIVAISSLTSIQLIVSGLIVSVSSSILSILLLNIISKNKVAVILFSIFPPVWIMSSVKIATEPLTVFLLLISLYLFLKKKYFLAGLIVGAATSVRLISICLLAAFAITLARKNKNKILSLISGFAIPLFLFVIYNLVIFGNIFYQILLYPKIGGASGSSIGILQLIYDIPRSLDWHQYRIFLSGFSYIALCVISSFILFKYQNKSDIFKISFYWALFSLVFILSYGPSPLLEEFPRFLVPFMPALIIGITAPFKKYE